MEREGISVSHPARFTLVGTMNPEEGQLRPQILDRFALSVKIETIKSPAMRAEIIRRELAHSIEKEKFEKGFAKADLILRNKVEQARKNIRAIKISPRTIEIVAMAMASLGVDGQRPDIVTIRSAIAYAALEGDKKVERKHIDAVVPLSVCHRTRNGGYDPPPDAEQVKKAVDDAEKVVKGDSMKAEPKGLQDIADDVIKSALSAIEKTSEEIKKNN